jgi:hypothetical protein
LAELQVERLLQVACELVADVQRVRRHRVEHERTRLPWMAHRELLGDAGAVGDADEVDLCGAERLPHRVEVADRVGGRVEAQVRIPRQGIAAALGRAPRLYAIVGVLVGVLDLAARERMRLAGATLVDQEDVALLQQFGERGRDLRVTLGCRLPGTAGEHEHRIGFGRIVVAGRDPCDVERDPAAPRRGRVFRDHERAALGLDARRTEFGRQRARGERNAPVMPHRRRSASRCACDPAWSR